MTEVVQRQCRDTALALGLRDRGVLAPGFKADLNVIDPEEIGMRHARDGLRPTRGR